MRNPSFGNIAIIIRGFPLCWRLIDSDDVLGDIYSSDPLHFYLAIMMMMFLNGWPDHNLFFQHVHTFPVHQDLWFPVMF